MKCNAVWQENSKKCWVHISKWLYEFIAAGAHEIIIIIFWIQSETGKAWRKLKYLYQFRISSTSKLQFMTFFCTAISHIHMNMSILCTYPRFSVVSTIHSCANILKASSSHSFPFIRFPWLERSMVQVLMKKNFFLLSLAKFYETHSIQLCAYLKRFSLPAI